MFMIQYEYAVTHTSTPQNMRITIWIDIIQCVYPNKVTIS